VIEPRPLHIGMEWPEDRPGGLNRYVADLLAALTADGGPVPAAIVLGPAASRPSGVDAVSGVSSAVWSRLLGFARATRRLVGTADVDLIVGHFPLYTIACLMWSRSARRLPRVMQFHGPWAAEAELAGDGSAVGLIARKQLQGSVLRSSDVVLAASGSFRRLAIEMYSLSPWSVRTITPGVDVQRFTPGDAAAARRRLGLPGEGFVAVCVRRLVPRCGVVNLVEDWAQVAQGTLVVVGDGPEMPAVEAAATAVGDGRVRVLGRVDDSDLVEAYRAADVAVLPSLDLEGFGLVTLEAMACGTPVVVTDVGGAPDPVRSLDPSAVVPARNRQAMVDRLGGAVDGSRPLVPRQVARSAAEQADWRLVAASHRALYREVVDPPAQRRPRVVVVAHTAVASGAEIMLGRVAPRIVEGGEVDLHVIVGEDGPLVARLTESGVSVEVLPLPGSTGAMRRSELVSLRGVGSALGGLRYAFRLARRLRRIRPDVVVPWSLKAALLTSPGARAARIPMVWALHEHPDRLPAVARPLATRMLPRIAVGVVANSEFTASSIDRNRSRVRVVTPPGFDSPPAPHLPNPDPGSIRVTVLGRLAPLKGQHIAIEAFATALADRPASLRIVGAPLFGEEDYAGDLHALVSRLGIEARVAFDGASVDPGAVLMSTDVLVHSSVDHEGWGMVVLEGMQAGLAVVATDTGGPAEQIDDGVTGRLVPAGDVDALARVLVELADDPAQRARLGAAAAAATVDSTPRRASTELVDAVLDLADLPRSVPVARRTR
jgi:glycosyltransferase involved in cell wall biosynthesis